MPLTNDDLQNFYQFALCVIKTDDKATSLRELADKWEAWQQRAGSATARVYESIQKGHAEIVAGVGGPQDDFQSEMKLNAA